jgi:hypothetical protein
MVINPLLLAYLVVCALLVASAESIALEIELFEFDEHHLGLRMAAPKSANDAALVEHYRATPTLAKSTADPAVFTILLDSTPGIGSYLKAARLSRGLYAHLPILCPKSNCVGIQFHVRAKNILFTNAIAQNGLTIDAEAAGLASVFFTNETLPRFDAAMYVGSEFSDAAALQLQKARLTLGRAYAEIADNDLPLRIGVVATTAKNNQGVSGFGGDKLNFIRLNYDNPTGVTEEEMVRIFTATLAHEPAHTLHPPALFELAHGRLITEGSADFLKIVLMRRTQLLDDTSLSAIVMRTYDDCARKRGVKGLYERIASREAHYREMYDCGMINYFALLFDSSVGEKAFLNGLVRALRDARAGASNSLHTCFFLILPAQAQRYLAYSVKRPACRKTGRGFSPN